MISHKHKCIFIHIPKCAGTSIEAALGHHPPMSSGTIQDHRPLRNILDDAAAGHKYFDKVLSQYRQRLLFKFGYKKNRNPNNCTFVNKRQFDRYFKFTFVRNPWARVYSWYRHVMRVERLQRDLDCAADMPFDVFVYRNAGRNNLRPQLFWIEDEAGNIPLDFIGRFDNLETDFQYICEKIGFPSMPLPHKLNGKSGDYRSAYDSKLKNFVGEFYAREIDLFGYDF